MCVLSVAQDWRLLLLHMRGEGELPTTRKSKLRVACCVCRVLEMDRGAHGGSREALPVDGAGAHLIPPLGGQSRERALRRRTGAGRELRGALGGHFGCWWWWKPGEDRGLRGDDLCCWRDPIMVVVVVVVMVVTRRWWL